MKRVLYLSNIEVPYRVRMFNQLAQYCDLTVLYERKSSNNRDSTWAGSEKKCYRSLYLEGLKLGNENSFSLKFVKEVLGEYDEIIVGCYNSPVQMAAIILLRMKSIPYILNVDGEVFIEGNGIKSRLKRFFLSGASRYLAAGEKSAASVKKQVGDNQVIPYYFSSLTESELEEHRKMAATTQRGATVLVIGQYFEYKGMDVALQAARMDPMHTYHFVGMGNRTALFAQQCGVQEQDNLILTPFLQKAELAEAYKTCSMVVLPSRQECWGLVVNEAASFGTPVISTWGSGAAVEFLSEKYPQYLAKADDPVSLASAIKALRMSPTEEYSRYLLEKSRKYSIEAAVEAHRKAWERI